MKKSAQQGELTEDMIYEIMSEEKANQTERISFKGSGFKRIFPKKLYWKADDRYNSKTAL